MSGKGDVRFSELFASTVNTHGITWAWGHYAKKGMTQGEFRFWMHSIRGV